MTDDRTAWLERRRRGIGASDIGAIVGLSPWASPMSVWLDKIGRTDDQEETEAMRWGHLLEQPIVQAFEEDTGLYVGGQQDERQHPDHPTHLATLDGIVYESPVSEDSGRAGAELGVFEAKFTGSAAWDEVPDHYACQVQWQMHVTGLNHAWLAALHRAFGRIEFRIYEIERDQTVIDLLTTAADTFWTDHVTAGVMPPADGADATAEALRAIYPLHVTGTAIELDENIAAEWHQAKAAVKTAEHDLKRLTQQIQQAMEDTETATVDGRPAFTWKASETTRLDTKALRAEHPDIADELSKTTTSRRFLAKPIKENEAA